MKVMSIKELSELCEWIEEQKKSSGVFYPAKYFHPCIDTRSMECFAINFRPWFGDEFTLDFRDGSKLFEKEQKEQKSFLEYVKEKLAERLKESTR